MEPCAARYPTDPTATPDLHPQPNL
jgi:hypothetical protein